MMLSDVCLSVAYIGPKSSTERPMKTKISTEVAHVTHDSDITFKIKRSSQAWPLTFDQAALLTMALTQLQRWAWERIGRGNLLLHCGLQSACAVGSAVRGASAPTEGGEGRGILWRPPTYSLFICISIKDLAKRGARGPIPTCYILQFEVPPPFWRFTLRIHKIN